MVVNDLKSAIGQKKKTNSKAEKEDEGDEDLYNLVRGKKSTMMIQRLDSDSDDYVPSRRVIMMISSDESEGENLVLFAQILPKCLLQILKWNRK